MSAAAPVIAEPRFDFDEQIAERRDDADSDYDGWFCVATAPWPCPAAGCGFIAHHMTGAHLIVVWPRIDDPALLGQARSASRLGRSPRVVPYEVALGPCIAWDEWWRIGRPVHGLLDRPDAWEEDAWRL